MHSKFNHKLIGLVLLSFLAASAYAGGGIEWTNINDGLPNDISISALTVDPGNSNIIYGAGSGGVYKTTDKGDNWTDITNGLAISSTDQVNKEGGGVALAVDSNNIYLGCCGRIFKGAKDGSNWVDITGTMTIAPWTTLSIVAQSGSIYVGNGDYDNSGGVYKSTDNGASWVKIKNLQNCTVITGTTTGNLYAFS
ncbi:hypothetical protein HY792_01155, partial [Candidatus Desantisbacteria bacterium]|nr:hypothetical protein [Candidatus Desantisbacteria bacterium]